MPGVGDPHIYADSFGVDGIVEPDIEAETWREINEIFITQLSREEKQAADSIPFSTIIAEAISIDAKRIGALTGAGDVR